MAILEESKTPLLLPYYEQDAGIGPLQEEGSCKVKSFANMFIAVIGAGVLGLPYAFMVTGWAQGTIILGGVAGLSFYCMMLLVWTKRQVESEQQEPALATSSSVFAISSFGDVGQAVCGRRGKMVVDIMIVLTQMSFCIGYLIFIGTTLSSLYISLSEKDTEQNPFAEDFKGDRFIMASFISGTFPIEAFLNSIKSLTHLAPLSLVADAVNVGTMGYVVVEDLVSLVHNGLGPGVVAFRGWNVVGYCAGVAIYCFEGIAMVVPLHAEAQHKSSFGRVMGLCLGIVAICYTAFGLLGYLAFGTATEHIVTLNLGNVWSAAMVNVSLSVTLLVTFPLMMNPVHEVAESRFNDGRYSFWLRCFNVVVTTVVAVCVPNFTDFLSLVGSSVCIVLGFILPAVFHWVACHKSCFKIQIVVDLVIIIVGSLFALISTAFCLLDLFY